MAKWLSRGERRLLNLNRHGVLSSLIFTDNSGGWYLDWECPGKDTNIIQKKLGIQTKAKKRPAGAGLFLLILSQKIIE